MFRDLRFAFRVLASRPGFTFVAALSLALGIGANSAIFSFVDGLWFRPLAVPQSGSIVRVFSVTDQDREGALSYSEFQAIQQQASALRDVVAVGGRGLMLVEGDSHQLLTLNLVSPNFFSALGIKPAAGRLFTPQDELAVVLGYSFWQRHFGGDPGVIGKQIRVQRQGEHLVTIIGVLPRSFRELDPGNSRDLWFSAPSWKTLGDVRELETPGSRWFRVIARVAPGSTVKSANAQLQTIAARMAQTWPDSNRRRRAACMSDLSYRLEQAGTMGIALLAIVLLVVAISSVNVANLLLSRAGTRGREMAVRLALGAGRAPLLRQLMTENLLLGAAGLVLGLGIGALLIGALPALMVPPPGFEGYGGVDFLFDSRVLLFSLAVSLATILLFGMAPAWKSTNPNLIPALKGESAFSVAGSRRWPLRNWLVIVQVAVSMTLLACGGLLARSFINTRTQDLGFGRRQLLLVWLSSDAKPSEYRELVSRFEGMPGVRRVAVAIRAPLSLSGNGMFQRVTFPGRREFENAPPFEIKFNAVSANFLETMGTPVLRGRGFDQREDADSSTSVLINQAMAQRFWPGQDPVGKTIRTGGSQGKLETVVGVVKNAPINSVGEPPEPYLYEPYWSNFDQEATFLLETEGEAPSLAQPARRVLKSVDARLDPHTITTENDLIRFSAQSYRMTAELSGVLGFLGLILTAVGLYGVAAYSVSQRTREFGIRMALGADRNDTLRLVLREVALMGAIGIAAGLPLAMFTSRRFSELLFGIGAWDIPTFAAAGLVLAAVLLVAGWIPARRATTADPASALRVF